jgi:hypothetical protein
MPSCIKSNAIYSQMQKFGVSPKILNRLPCTFVGVHQGVLNQLAVSGIIHNSRKFVVIKGGRRAIWDAGPLLPKFRKWCKEHGK